MKHFLTVYELEINRCNSSEGKADIAIDKLIYEYLDKKIQLSTYAEKSKANKKLEDLTEGNKIEDLQKYLSLKEYNTDESKKIIDGFFKCGDYGFEAELYDTKLEELKATQKKDDVLLIPFYFYIHIRSTTKALVVLQKSGIVGIKTAVLSDLESFCTKYYSDYKLRMSSVAQNEIAAEFFKKGKITSAKVTLNTCPPELADQISDDSERKKYQKNFKAELRFHPDSIIRGWIDSFDKNVNKPGTMKIYGQDVKEIRVKKQYGGRVKTFVIDRILETSIDLELTPDIIDTNSGHPVYAKVKQEARLLLENILR